MNQEQVTGFEYVRYFPLDQLYDLIEELPFQYYPLHELICQQNNQCSSDNRIRQLLNAIMWLKEYEHTHSDIFFITAAAKGILPAMKILFKYYGADPTTNNNLPFIAATQGGYLDIVEFLESIGASGGHNA